MTQPTSFPIPTASDGSNTSPENIAIAINASLTALLDSHSGTSAPSYVAAGMVWRNSTTDQLFMYDGTSSRPIAVQAAVPSSASDTGTAGDVSWDADYIYVCTATDTWKRVAIATW